MSIGCSIREFVHTARLGLLERLEGQICPEGKSWLPILHTEREGWCFTALFSNTAKAHELVKTRDWVVLYYERDGHEGQHTVVTETLGLLKGRRVVRGREAECAAFYASSAPARDTPSRTRHDPPQPAS